ncbi:MAG: hypothetical protein R3C52_02980 [Hyphomonadaceae bacterium]
MDRGVALLSRLIAGGLAGCSPAADRSPESDTTLDGAPSAAAADAPETEAAEVLPRLWEAGAWEAVSSTAMAFTPGVLTVTPIPSLASNDPGGALFEFENGIRYKTRLMFGAAEQADQIDWAGLTLGGSARDVSMYSVEQASVPDTARSGGLCPEAFALGTYRTDNAAGPMLMIIAFAGDVWPPVTPDAVCGTFTYAPASAPPSRG